MYHTSLQLIWLARGTRRMTTRRLLLPILLGQNLTGHDYYCNWDDRFFLQILLSFFVYFLMGWWVVWILWASNMVCSHLHLPNHTSLSADSLCCIWWTIVSRQEVKNEHCQCALVHSGFLKEWMYVLFIFAFLGVVDVWKESQLKPI